jgi:hypothetical protein
MPAIPPKPKSTAINTAQRVDLMRRIAEIIKNSTADPGQELITTGEALIKVGNILKGQSIRDAQAVINATIELFGVDI